MTGLGRSLLVGAAIAIPLMQPGVPDALLDQSDMSPELRESAITLVENTGEAVQEGVEGARQGEDAASAEQVAEAEYSDTSPPPPGSTFGGATPEPQMDDEPGSDPTTGDLAASTPEPQAEADAGPVVGQTPEPDTGAGVEPSASEAVPGPDHEEPDVREPEPEL